jgi:hypothetical protein
MENEIKLEVYSPRWGHNDTYTILMSLEEMTIKMSPRVAKATYKKNIDPEWSGEKLVHILTNDNIYPPAIFQDCIEHVWLKWRDGELDNQEATLELNILFEWLNEITALKPESDFWTQYF